jgi:hypothetical protein
MRFLYKSTIAFIATPDRIAVKSRRLSLIAATASLLGFPQFPVRLPCHGSFRADINNFGHVPASPS